MSIDSVKFGLKSLSSMDQLSGIEKSGTTEKVSGQPSFGQIMENAVAEVNDLQLEADQQIEGLVLGKGEVSTHDAMIALEKADVAFQLMNTIRGRIVRAYEEVMRTQI